MSTKKCCKTCQHCCPGQSSSDSWCRLRKIKVHSEMVLFALCHHWTQKQPSLPKLKPALLDNLTDQQLEFDRAFVTPDRF